MNETFKISDITVRQVGGKRELSASLNGYVIYFRVPESCHIEFSAEVMVAAALLEAMVSGADIEVEKGSPISSKLLDRLSEVQAVYSCWNPDLKKISIHADAQELHHSFVKVGSFFSAGVDSSHTLLDNMDDITHLVMFRSFDSGNDQEFWDERVVSQSVFAKSIDKVLIPVETNLREWMYERKISWEFGHGLLLASIGTALGLSRVYIPSSHTYSQLFPWGSHPVSDPMWSTESTEVVHHGSRCRRGEKIEELLTNPQLMNNLQVCWKQTDKNCGECSKCIRTMLAIHLLRGQTDSLPALQDYRGLVHLKAREEGLASQLEDTIVLAKRVSNKEVYKILRRYYRRYQISRFWTLVDRYLLGGLLCQLYRKVRRPDWLNWRVTMHSSSNWDS